MKVAHICQSADPNIGGSLTVAQALVRAQREQGVDARLVYLYRSDQAQVKRHSSTESFCQVSRESRWLRGIGILQRRLKDISPDIIHHHDGLLWPRFATVGLNRPLITHGHLGPPDRKMCSGAYWTHRYISWHTDCLIAISSWVRESWISAGFPKERTRLIPNGIDCVRFHRRSAEVRQDARVRLRLPKNQTILLWVGRLDRETKGLDRLVAIAGCLPAEIKLVIIGDGPARHWLNSKLEVLNFDRRPLLLGRVDDPAELFGIADAFLFTSKVEPFGMVLLEAAVSGLPIFAFECAGGGMDLLQKLNAVVVSNGSARELVQALTSDWPKFDDQDIAQIRREYSWTAVAQSTSALYAEFTD